jgi:hypothetical protein
MRLVISHRGERQTQEVAVVDKDAGAYSSVRVATVRPWFYGPDDGPPTLPNVGQLNMSHSAKVTAT